MNNRTMLTTAYIHLMAEPPASKPKLKWVIVYRPYSRSEVGKIEMEVETETQGEAYALAWKYKLDDHYIAMVNIK